jgi:hypothetical protein
MVADVVVPVILQRMQAPARKSHARDRQGGAAAAAGGVGLPDRKPYRDPGKSSSAGKQCNAQTIARQCASLGPYTHVGQHEQNVRMSRRRAVHSAGAGCQQKQQGDGHLLPRKGAPRARGGHNLIPGSARAH